MKRIALILLLFILGNNTLLAQSDYSYFYFEGDLETPFYVKVEGQMQPRYGQNHFIIPNLDEGYTHFEILFQKNEYPPQKFFLEVPKNGFRSFVLHKASDQKFMLLDIQQQIYIPANNTKDQGAAGNIKTYVRPLPKEALKSGKESSRPSKHIARGSSGSLSLFPEDSILKLSQNKNTDSVSYQSSTEGAFINDIVLNDNGKTSSKQAQIANTDCPNAMSNEAFETFALKLLDKEGDENRLKYLKKQATSYCFSTEQVRIIAANLSMQSARYEAVKLLYQRTSDQKNYNRLESLFNTPFLKEKFKAILHP